MKKIDEEILLLIMIGGQSKRMGGGIKSFIKINNKNIFDRILDKTKPQINKIVINCNEKEDKLFRYDFPIIKDLKKGYLGPLAGIHSAFNWINKNEPQIKWLITIPGDTPFIPKNLIHDFKKKISSKSKIILAQSNYKTHPIIGAWHVSLSDSLNFNLEKGIRKIMSWAQLHPIEFINYSIEKYDPFFNINTIDDIHKANKIEEDFLEKN